jgi:hypothetical protein
VGQKHHQQQKGKEMETEIQKPRQTATLYSWNTAINQIKVKVSGNHLEVRIGDLAIVMSAVSGEQVLDLAAAFSQVEVTDTVTKTVRV